MRVESSKSWGEHLICHLTIFIFGPLPEAGMVIPGNRLCFFTWQDCSPELFIDRTLPRRFFFRVLERARTKEEK